MRGGRLSWFVHVLRRPLYAPVHRRETMVSEGVKMGKGRPKMT